MSTTYISVLQRDTWRSHEILFFLLDMCKGYCSTQPSGMLHLTIAPVGPCPLPNHSLASWGTALALALGITEGDLIWR